MNYHPLVCTNALHNLRRKNPYSWDLNIYRGCEHGCNYCFAIYSHDYLNDGRFFENLYVKTNIVEQLEKELRNPSWKRQVINIGGVTDSYQPVEKNYQFMPEILKLLIKYKTPAIISTKSDLILRDYDLIDQLSRITYINVAATIITHDEQQRIQLEPGAVSIAQRFAMLKEFRKTNASVGMHQMPIIPFLTDSNECLESLYCQAKDSAVHYVLPGTMYLRGKTKPYFLQFIKTEYPTVFLQLNTLYKNGGAGTEYKTELYNRLHHIRNKYGLSGSYTALIKEKMPKERDLFSQF
ncbi:MAG: hypothetical protein JW922_01490 [Paludibacteraceae bacterium]|nr:hypothetical protein [Paludibacteraceae bacterium]